jgi:hypothetical protein
VISIDNPPRRAGLAEIAGKLEWFTVTSGKYGGAVHFRLESDNRELQYISKAGKMGVVETALRGAGEQRIRVLIDPKDDFRYLTVLELVIGEHTIRSYDDVSCAWEGDNKFGVWIAAGLALAGLAMIIRSFRRQPAA